MRATSFFALFVFLSALGTPVLAQDADEKMLHRRAVEAVIWAMPAVSMRAAINATKRDLGGDWNDVVYFSKPMVSRHGFLTANNQTPYVISSINTKDGPIVVEAPPASTTTRYFGSFIDAWQLPIADVGPTGDDDGAGQPNRMLVGDVDIVGEMTSAIAEGAPVGAPGVGSTADVK